MLWEKDFNRMKVFSHIIVDGMVSKWLFLYIVRIKCLATLSTHKNLLSSNQSPLLKPQTYTDPCSSIPHPTSCSPNSPTNSTKTPNLTTTKATNKSPLSTAPLTPHTWCSLKIISPTSTAANHPTNTSISSVVMIPATGSTHKKRISIMSRVLRG